MSKAQAIAWFTERDGKKIVTVQHKPNGDEWRPGARVASVTGNRITLDGSRVSLDGKTATISDGGTLVTLTWRDGTGEVIHTTTYSEPLPA